MCVQKDDSSFRFVFISVFLKNVLMPSNDLFVVYWFNDVDK